VKHLFILREVVGYSKLKEEEEEEEEEEEILKRKLIR
jgi:hypothetical protein